MVPFKGGYHTLLGRPALVKFMAIPCYAYMKLKMPGPNGVITVCRDAKNALEVEVANLELAKAELAAFDNTKVSTTTDEVAQAIQKKLRPDHEEQEARMAPTDLSSSNNTAPAQAGYEHEG